MNFTERDRRGELERALCLLRSGREAPQVVEELSRRLTNKLLHAPIVALKEKCLTPSRCRA
jgi:glutamyl-tRNA reductase